MYVESLECTGQPRDGSALRSFSVQGARLPALAWAPRADGSKVGTKVVYSTVAYLDPQVVEVHVGKRIQLEVLRTLGPEQRGKKKDQTGDNSE